MDEQGLQLLDSKKNDKVAVPVCAQEHERYYPTPPHPNPPVTDHERAVPVSAGQQERWWGCCACVCTRTRTLLPHPTPLEHEWEMIKAGMALFDIDLHVVWQVWHFLTSTFMLRGRRDTFGHRPSCCVAGVALGNIVLTTIFLIGDLFLVLFSLWNAPGFQSIAPVSKSHVCVVGIVLMICVILCSKVGRKWLCSKVMHQTVFQSDPATSGTGSMDLSIWRAGFFRKVEQEFSLFLKHRHEEKGRWVVNWEKNDVGNRRWLKWIVEEMVNDDGVKSGPEKNGGETWKLVATWISVFWCPLGQISFKA